MLALGAGTPNINVPAGRSGQIKEERSQRPVNFAMAFGEDVARRDGGKPGLSKEISAGVVQFPFWPFVLATTSIGQEGLDFTSTAETSCTGTSLRILLIWNNARGG